MFILNEGMISWKSSKHVMIGDSTTKLKYIAASEAVKEVVWIKKFITELGVVPSIIDPISINYNNIGAIAQGQYLAYACNRYVRLPLCSVSTLARMLCA